MRVIDVIRDVYPNQSRRRKSVAETMPSSGVAAPSLLAGIGLALREKIMTSARRLLGWGDLTIGRSRVARFLTVVVIYGIELSAVFYLSYAMRWDFDIPAIYQKQWLTLIIPIVVCKLVLLRSFGQFRSILSYFGLVDFGGVALAMGTVSAMMMSLWYASNVTAAPPRGVVLMDFVLSVALISAFRLSLRIMRMWSVSGEMRPGLVERRVAIIGTGDVGQAFANGLLQRRGCGLQPVFFIDDDPKKIGRSIHGLPIYGPLEKLTKLAARLRVNELVVTQAGITAQRLREIVGLGRQLGATTQIIPMFKQLSLGEAKIDRTRPVTIEDLLGREPVNLDCAGIAHLVQDRVVLVTGAGGSIGSELCRQILACQPKQLVMVDQSEFVLFEIEQELVVTEYGHRIVPVIADVRDEEAIRAVFERCRPVIVFHAAAHKHVPLMEQQPREAIRNNTLATASLAAIASEYEVERFIFISTDKAINPTSVMGCSKRLAEKALQARQRVAGNRTAFMAVRFGNVLGSSGSVIPTFKRQIAQGGPVTVTHRDMTRYFMTIPEAVGLVLQTATIGKGGEIFILDMGRPVKIMDMARQMIELSGFKPDADIKIKITGLRPGEKLFEELCHTEETHVPTAHERIFRLKNENGADEEAEVWLSELRTVASEGDQPTIKRVMNQLVPEYTPCLSAQSEMLVQAVGTNQ